MRKFILDTDMGCDCDDVGALAIMFDAVKNGDAELLAITHSISKVNGLRFMENMLKRYDLDVPVCKCALPGFMDTEKVEKYSSFLKVGVYDNERTDYPDSVKIMRKLLAENDKVTLITIGPFVNLAALLESEADEFSGLDGISLVSEKVDAVYSMAGNFVNKKHCEFNVECDIEGARYVAGKCPVPIIYSGYEVGEKIVTGSQFENFSDDSILKKAYGEYNRHGDKSFKRFSWDPCTVFQALYPDNDIFGIEENVKVWFDEKGITFFEKGGKDKMMTVSTENIERAVKALDEKMV